MSYKGRCDVHGPHEEDFCPTCGPKTEIQEISPEEARVLTRGSRMPRQRRRTVTLARKEWLTMWLRDNGYLKESENPEDACYYEFDFAELLKLVAHAFDAPPGHESDPGDERSQKW